jgi:cytidylate kinase
MYRGITFAALSAGIDIDDEQAVANLSKRVELDMTDDSLVVDGIDATVSIRQQEVTSLVSAVAANPQVRAELRAQQRLWVEERGGGVVEGRDIATVVFPDAILKIFLTASPMVRAQRRVGQSGGDVEEIAQQIAQRDFSDSTRIDGPLREDSDALVIDTSEITIEEAVDAIAHAFTERTEN